MPYISIQSIMKQLNTYLQTQIINEIKMVHKFTVMDSGAVLIVWYGASNRWGRGRLVGGGD